jgi:hypothetical protein
LHPGIIQAVTQALDEDVVEKNVFFPVLTRYFQSKGKVFDNMIADLLHHRETVVIKRVLAISLRKN